MFVPELEDGCLARYIAGNPNCSGTCEFNEMGLLVQFLSGRSIPRQPPGTLVMDKNVRWPDARTMVSDSCWLVTTSQAIGVLLELLQR